MLVGCPNLFIVLKPKNRELRDGDEIFIDLNENFIKDYALIDYIYLRFIDIRKSKDEGKNIVIKVFKEDLVSDVLKK